MTRLAQPRQGTWGNAPGAGAGRGFSLVEVTLALGVFSFCFITVVGLLPVGINTNRDTIDGTRAAGLARVIQGDLETAPSGAAATTRFKISFPTANPNPTPPNGTAPPNATLFFQDDCASFTAAAVSSGAAPSRYRADLSFGPQDYAGGPLPVHLLITWPALANLVPQQWPTQSVGHFEIVTMVNH